MTTLQKLGLAGFVGTVVCIFLVGGTSLLTDSILCRSLAFAASVGIGYLAYEFGDVLRAVPPALEYAKEQIGIFGQQTQSVVTELRGEIKKPHPFGYLSVTLFMLPVFFIVNDGFHYGVLSHGNWVPITDVGVCSYIGMVSTVFAFLGAVFWVAFTCIAAYGACWEQKRWTNDFGKSSYETLELTYLRGYKWLLIGLARIVWFFCWTMWSNILPFVWHFVRELVRIVHSSERLMVTVDGNSMGLVAMAAYWYWGPASSTMFNYLALMVFGGVLGMASVMINVRYVAPYFGYNFLPQRTAQ